MISSRIILVANHSVVRLGLRMLLTAKTTTIIGEAATANEGENLAAMLQPDIVLLDSCLPDSDDLSAISRLAKAAPSARVVLLSDREDEEFVERALLAGASGYLLNQTAAADLGWAIQAAQKGREYFSPSLIQKLRDPAAIIPEPDQLEDLERTDLTQMEARLMALINQGLIIKQMARDLRASIETIGSHHPALLKRIKPQRLGSIFGWHTARRWLGMQRNPQPAGHGAA